METATPPRARPAAVRLWKDKTCYRLTVAEPGGGGATFGAESTAFPVLCNYLRAWGLSESEFPTEADTAKECIVDVPAYYDL